MRTVRLPVEDRFDTKNRIPTGDEAMSNRAPESQPLPPYSYVPGGRWPHPRSSPLGHLHGIPPEHPPAIEGDAWSRSEAYLRGVELFNAGYYWEAHEAWEALWHAHGRRGAAATVLKGLIKLAAAGVKVREGRVDGVRTLALRASAHFAEALAIGGERRLGLDLAQWIKHAEAVSSEAPNDHGSIEKPVRRVFSIRLEPYFPP
jgi:hypothetical protein